VGQKVEIEPLESKNGIWGPNSVWCDTSINQKLYMEKIKIDFWGSKRRKKVMRAQKQIWAQKSVWSCDISIDLKF
jgi:hypothetical protein